MKNEQQPMPVKIGNAMCRCDLKAALFCYAATVHHRFECLQRVDGLPNGFMNFEAFYRSMFELVDNWYHYLR